MKRFLTRNILLLSLISLFNDLSSEMLYPVLPLYLESVGFGVLWIGIVEGIAEATAGVLKGYFGRVSDKKGIRIPFIRWGYLLSAVSKPLLVVFRFVPWVLAMRMTDRFGKGLRTGARDAMLTEESEPADRGKVFGFHRGMDTLGAVFGPLFALLFLTYYGFDDAHDLFWWAAIPGIIGVGLTFFILEKRKERSAEIKNERVPFFNFSGYWKKATPEYKRLFTGLGIFFLFNSSDVFLLLIVKRLGFAETYAIGFYILYNIAYVLAAYPAGWLGDRFGMKRMLLGGLGLFALVYAGMAGLFLWEAPQDTQQVALVALFALYGMYAACMEGVAKAWLSKTCEKSESGQAMGLFSGMQSIAALVASTLAGIIFWASPSMGPAIAFFLTAGAALTAILYLSGAKETKS